jgi:recombination protein RecT
MGTVVDPKQTAPKTQLTLRSHLASPEFAAQVAKALPKHVSADRMIRVALTAITKTPKLADCTQASFFQALLNCSQWGLEPDGRRAHLIPYGNVCTLIIDYKGIVELCFRSGNVKAIHADIVRQGDLFSYSSGYVEKHTPWFLRTDSDKPSKAGEVFAAYCIVQMKDGAAKHDVMSKDEIEAIRKRSRAGTSGPWVTDWNEMAKKTVFRRCSKWLPWSAEIIDAFDREDDVLEDVPSRHLAHALAPPSLDSLAAKFGEQEQPAIETTATESDAAEPSIAEQFATFKTEKDARAFRDSICGPDSTATPEEMEHAEECFEQWKKSHK